MDKSAVWSALVSAVSTDPERRQTFSGMLNIEVAPDLQEDLETITRAFLVYVHDWKKGTPLAHEPLVYVWGMIMKPVPGGPPEPVSTFGFIVKSGLTDLEKLLRN